MNRNAIKTLAGREIINGRGVPAVEVEITTETGIKVRASSPSGISIAAHEAVEIRDGGSRYGGKGVLKAVKNINEIVAPELIGIDVTSQDVIDRKMIALDGTPNKSRLGGNALTAVSIAAAKAGSRSVGMDLFQYIGGMKARSLPTVCLNMISGSPTAGNELDFEDYLLAPYGFDSFKELLQASIEVFHMLHRKLEKKYGLIAQITALAPPLKTNEEAFEVIVEAIEEAGYGDRMGVGIDAATAQLYDEKTQKYVFRDRTYTRSELIDYYVELCGKYPLLFIEDGLHEDDLEGFSEMTRKVPSLIIGDDLFATNKERLLRGAKIGAANAILFKVNQAGTITESLETAQTANELNYTIVASTRSGETEDSAQADLAVAVGARLMKLGCPLRGEMVVKYNRFLKIEEELGNTARLSKLNTNSRFKESI